MLVLVNRVLRVAATSTSNLGLTPLLPAAEPGKPQLEGRAPVGLSGPPSLLCMEATQASSLSSLLGQVTCFLALGQGSHVGDWEAPMELLFCRSVDPHLDT